jgi:hypothetical protein
MRLRCPATSSPPSVVSSWRRSGTRQQSCGRTRGDIDHFIGDGHFEIKPRCDGTANQLDVAILDMPPIFPQVGGDGIGTRLFRFDRRLHRVGIGRAARLAQRRHVVDVHAKPDHSSISGIVSEFGAAVRWKSLRLCSGLSPR